MELQQRAHELIGQAIAPSTKLAYDSGYNTYRRFLALSNISNKITEKLPPVSEQLLIKFSTYCHQSLNLKYSTIKLYLCGIRFHYLSTTSSNPFDYVYYGSNLLRLQLLLKGIKRADSKPQRIRHPITSSILIKICERLHKRIFHNFLDLMMETVCTVAFFGFLRCSEFTCKTTFDPSCNLCIGDLRPMPDHIILNLQQSKTDPFRQGVKIKLFCTGATVCPKCILDKYLTVRTCASNFRNTGRTDPLFVLQTGLPLNRKTFLQLFQDTLSAAGIQQEHYTGHSFRIGAATSAAASKIEDHLIKTMGRWTSDSYCRYIQTPSSTLHSAQITLAGSTATGLQHQ